MLILKKTFCLFLIVALLCLIFAGCNDSSGGRSIVAYPLKEVNVIYDQFNNILQQTLYNETTGEYIQTDYTYAYQDGRYVCIDQRTTIINYNSPSAVNTALKIYHNKDLNNGPIILIDNEYVKVSIVKYLAKDSWWEFGYELKVVNKTKDIITTHIDNTTIMDINCSPLFYTEHIAPGDTEYFTLAWDSDTLERCYIPYIDNIEFMIRVFDNDNWRTPALCGERVLIKQ